MRSLSYPSSAAAAGNTEPERPDCIGLARYREAGGYRTLAACVGGERGVDAVIKELENSALRGLGGAGFPAGRKWRIVRAEPAPRLMAVNIDEGEPGTFKDRHYLERDPHRFLEGMLIAAWAVGIDAIYVYLRDEYAACRELLTRELFQHDVNVVWDLAPHDLAIMDYLLGAEPQAVAATGQSHLNGLEDMAYITVYFKDRMLAHINVNWLSPVKVRTTLIGGEKKMVVWNDLEADEKVKVYDKGVEITNGQGVYDLLVSYRSGDMWAPRVEQSEALKAEAKYFVECIEKNQTPFNDGHAGLRVVRILEAACQSLKQRGAPVELNGRVEPQMAVAAAGGAR